MFIIDASVVIKWFVEEQDSVKAISLRDEHVQGKTVLIAPDLLIYEVTNVLMISKIFTPAEIKRSLQDLYELEIDLIAPSIDIILTATELAIDKRISIYDASYIALAKELDVRFITADEKLAAALNEPHCLALLSQL